MDQLLKPPTNQPRTLLPALEMAENAARDVDYTFGDRGSQWRMTKLKAVYTLAEETGKFVDEVATERFGSLEDFDDAREEKEEMDRRRIYGDKLVTKEKPTGDLYRQREAAKKDEPRPTKRARSPDQIPFNADDEPPANAAPSIDQTALNRLRAQMMKAKLRKAPNAAQLELEYNLAAKNFQPSSSDTPVVLGGMHSRELAGTRNEVKAVTNKRGRERGTVEENNDMSIEDMVREERRTKYQAGGEGKRLAERIAKDGKFDNDLEYMDENAEKLAKRVHKSEINLKNMAVDEFKKIQSVLDSCPLCHQDDSGRGPVAPVLSLATRTYLTLIPEPEISPGGAMIVPLTHRQNLLHCDDDEWEELRNFMKSLTRMYHDQGREVIFYENAAHPHRHKHAALTAVPIPYSEGATAPAYFREAFLSADEEWSQHKKIIDTQKIATQGSGQAKMAFRNSIAKEMPYFHVWFDINGGAGHVIEDGGKWPKGDVFAREVLAGIVDVDDPTVVKRQGRFVKGDGRAEGWKKGWRKFDWTRVLEES